ncbi:MAG: NUDIX domain-containing protein [Candidatus Magasanikbacteria bacterium]|nr:NUDIX domain-containing protein [Candidatus Magasanikbacteria bacterium]
MTHTQVAGGVVLNSRGEVLVTCKSGQSWSLPKGHIDEGETARVAAEREIFEETGVSELHYVADLGAYDRYRTSLDGGDDTSELKTITMFLYTTPESELQPADPEHPEARWVAREEVAKLLTHKKDQEFFSSLDDRTFFVPPIQEIPR